MTADSATPPTRVKMRRRAQKPPPVAAARLVLFWEQALPALIPVLAPALLVASAGLLGLWSAVPSWLHLAVLICAAGATAAAAIRYRRAFRWPSRREGLTRLERDGGLAHAPLQALDDRPFANGDDELWRAHMADMARRAAGARLARPDPDSGANDPLGLRYAAPGLLAIALIAAGAQTGPRLAAAFAPQFGAAGEVATIDLWIEPPAYTGKAPIYLLRAGQQLAGERSQIDAPVGSVAIAQVGANSRVLLALRTREGEARAEPDETNAGRRRVALSDSGLLRLRAGGAEGRWPIGAIPDHPPAVYFLEEPRPTDDARLAFAVSVEDDYGVATAALRLRLDPEQDRPLDAPDFDESTIRERRLIALQGISGVSGERRFDLDLQEDPWAGLRVIGSLVVSDGAGQTAESEEVAFRLPARPFYNPLARAVLEQRQTLATAPASWRRAGRSLDALTLAPEHFYDRSTDYLLMRTAFWRVMRQKGESFSEVVGEFWPLALQLEDEALELARRRLQAAQDALRQALESGAADSELERLIEELRAAMQGYLQALAESGGQMNDMAGAPSEMLEAGDLEEMLNAIRDLAQSGAQRAARQALNDLENILNNLRMAGRGGGQGGAGGGEQGGPAGQAGDLIGRQRELANRAFEEGQTPGAGGGGLAGEEGALADDLRELLDGLREGGAGMDPSGEGARALGEALSSMRDAESALQGDDFDAAGSAMERAIDRLRQGAQALAEAQGEAARRQMEAGEGAGAPLDPLGRPIGPAYGRGVEVPEMSDVQRARDVLDALRRRMSDGKRSREEIEYLERLLERF